MITAVHTNPKHVMKRRSQAVLTLVTNEHSPNAVRLTHSLSIRLTPPYEDTSKVDVMTARNTFRTMLEGVYFDLPHHLRHTAPLSGDITEVEVASCPQTASPKVCQYVLSATLGKQTIIVDSVASLVDAWTNGNTVLSMVEQALSHSGWEMENRSYFLSASKTPRQWLVRACVDQNITLVFEVPGSKGDSPPQPATDLAT